MTRRKSVPPATKSAGNATLRAKALRLTEQLRNLRRRQSLQNQAGLVRVLLHKRPRQRTLAVHRLSLVINTDATSLKSFAGTRTRPSGPSRRTAVGVISAIRP